MPRSLSGDVPDWCLSFISLALIWHSTCFIIISAKKSISHQPFFPTCRAEYTFASMEPKEKKKKGARGTSLSIDHILKKTQKNTARRWTERVRKGCSLKQTVNVKWFCEEVADSLLVPAKQTNSGARQSAITDLCSKKPSNLFPLYLIRKSRGIFNVHSVNGKQLTGAN